MSITMMCITGYQYPTGILPCKLNKITIFDCSNRKLTDIPPLPSNITRLLLYGNKLWRITPPTTNGKISTNLKKIKSVFSGQVNLTYLDLSHNILRNIKDSPFADLSSLQTLILDSSSIKTIGQATFKGLYNLKHLNLSLNLFRSLPDGIFHDLSRLQTLYMKSNNLTRLPQQIMAPLQALTILHLYIKDKF